MPTMAVYAGTKNAVRTTTRGFALGSRGQPARDRHFSGIRPHEPRAFDDKSGRQISNHQPDGQEALPPEAIARAIAFAIEQPAEVDVNEIVIRPTAQS